MVLSARTVGVEYDARGLASTWFWKIDRSTGAIIAQQEQPMVQLPIALFVWIGQPAGLVWMPSV